jgi:hypothetical protein
MDIRYSPTFTLLQQEGSLAKTMLLQGFESVIKGNLDTESQGNLYNGFFNLSIGTERLLKICAIINHLVKHMLTPPSNNDLFKFGHDIESLYEHFLTTTNHTQIAPGNETKSKLLNFLTDFAKTTRYYNLDSLSGRKVSREPISVWYELLNDCWENEFSEARKEKIARKLMSDLDRSGQVGYVYELDFENQAMTTFDSFIRRIIVEKATPVLINHLIEILRPTYHYLSDVCGTKAFNANPSNPSIPYMYEFFPFLLSTKAHTLRTKAWTRLF